VADFKGESFEQFSVRILEICSKVVSSRFSECMSRDKLFANSDKCSSYYSKQEDSMRSSKQSRRHSDPTSLRSCAYSDILFLADSSTEL